MMVGWTKVTAQEIVGNDWIVIFLSRTNKLGERVHMKERVESRIT